MVERTTRNGEVSRSIRLEGIHFFYSFNMSSFGYPRSTACRFSQEQLHYLCHSDPSFVFAVLSVLTRQLRGVYVGRFAQACVEPGVTSRQNAVHGVICSTSSVAHNNDGIRIFAIKLMKALSRVHVLSALHWRFNMSGQLEAKRPRLLFSLDRRGVSRLPAAPLALRYPHGKPSRHNQYLRQL